MEFINTKNGDIIRVIGVSFNKGAYWVMSNVPAAMHSAVGQLGDDKPLYDAIACEWDDVNKTYWCEVRLSSPWVEYFPHQGILNVTIGKKIFMFRISTHRQITILIHEVIRDALGLQAPFSKIEWRHSHHLKNYDGEWMEI